MTPVTVPVTRDFAQTKVSFHVSASLTHKKGCLPPSSHQQILSITVNLNPCLCLSLKFAKTLRHHFYIHKLRALQDTLDQSPISIYSSTASSATPASAAASLVISATDSEDSKASSTATTPK
eukprot:1983594-Prymnesium_polylepis.1